MLMKISHQQLAVKTPNKWDRQSSAAVVAVVILLHASVVYFISLEEINRPVVVKQQTIDVKIIQAPVPPPVITKPPEPPKLTKQPPQPVEKTTPKVSKASTKPSPSTLQKLPKQDIPQSPAKPTSTPVSSTEQAVIAETTATNSNAAERHSSQKTANAAPANSGSSNKAASTESRSGCSAPEYPEESALNGDEGTTTLALLISENGKVLDAKLDQSSGFADLDRAARKALVRCTFQPATRHGQPQQSWAKLSWKWQLKD